MFIATIQKQCPRFSLAVQLSGCFAHRGKNGHTSVCFARRKFHSHNQGGFPLSSTHINFTCIRHDAVPWVPDVFSRVRQGASFVAGKHAEDTSGEAFRAGHFKRLNRNRKPRMKSLWHQGNAAGNVARKHKS